MGQRRVRVREFTCNVCGKVEYAGANEELPQGWHIKSIFRITGGGGDGVEDVWVCQGNQCESISLDDLFARVHQQDYDANHPTDEQLARRAEL